MQLENFRSKLADTPVCGDTSKAFPPLTEEQEETVYFLYHPNFTLEVVNRAVDITVLENKFYHALKSISSWDIPSGSSSDSANVDNNAYTKFVWVYGFSG